MMSSNARNNILARLREPERPAGDFSGRDRVSRHDWTMDERIKRFTERMEAVRTEVHHATPDTWLNLLADICRHKGLNNLLLSSDTPWGEAIAAQAAHFPALRHYEHVIEDWKHDMFNAIDASLTSTLGGIAETGSLMLWASEHEPRQMSLVPPVHIALLERDKLYTTFAEAIQAQGWAETGMPTNALLISGPSKSADIAQVLAYGVHGPKELVVILV